MKLEEFNSKYKYKIDKDKLMEILILPQDKANPFKQAYEYIKTLPEYADAIDC